MDKRSSISSLDSLICNLHLHTIESRIKFQGRYMKAPSLAMGISCWEVAWALYKPMALATLRARILDSTESLARTRKLIYSSILQVRQATNGLKATWNLQTACTLLRHGLSSKECKRIKWTHLFFRFTLPCRPYKHKSTLTAPLEPQSTRLFVTLTIKCPGRLVFLIQPPSPMLFLWISGFISAVWAMDQPKRWPATSLTPVIHRQPRRTPRTLTLWL